MVHPRGEGGGGVQGRVSQGQSQSCPEAVPSLTKALPSLVQITTTDGDASAGWWVDTGSSRTSPAQRQESAQSAQSGSDQEVLSAAQTLSGEPLMTR